ncbi:hypothetical protein ACN3XK_72210 [Actinomadura welshii]
MCPAEFRSAHRLVPDSLLAPSGHEATKLIGDLAAAPPAVRAELLAGCLHRLDLMRVSRQITTLNQILTAGTNR